MKRKIFSVLLTAMLLVTAIVVLDLCVISYADETASGSCGDNLTWTLDDEGTLTISGTGNMVNWDAPWDLTWYSHTNSIKNVIIENGVTSIGSCAFESCDNLTSINIPDSVTSIGSSAFDNCRKLTSINIPYSVSYIGDSAFVYCSTLTDITVDVKNQYYSSQDGVLFDKNKTSLLQYPIGNLQQTYNIPYSVTHVSNYAFFGCKNLTDINIPDSTSSIGNYAFYGCDNLTSINLPNGVTSIGNSAFENSKKLTSVSIPSSVSSIGNSVFGYCSSLSDITVDIKNQYYSSQDGVLFDKNKTSLLQYPIGNSRQIYELPDSVISIGNNAFHRCNNLTSINIPDSLSSIGNSAFENCTMLTSITIPHGVTYIGNSAFYGCDSLTSVIIGNGVTTINDYTFFYCSNLTSVVIPGSITNIDKYAFGNCYNLSTVNYIGTQEEWYKININSSGRAPLSNANKIFLLEKGSIPFEGAQIRNEGKQGLRYIFKIPKVLSENCLEFGSVVMPKKYLGENALEIGLVTNVNGKNYAAKKVPALKIFGEDSEYIYYTVCITKIKESNYSSEYVAVPYVITKNADGTDRITYGEEQGMTVNEVMSALSE